MLTTAVWNNGSSWTYRLIPSLKLLLTAHTRNRLRHRRRPNIFCWTSSGSLAHKSSIPSFTSSAMAVRVKPCPPLHAHNQVPLQTLGTLGRGGTRLNKSTLRRSADETQSSRFTKFSDVQSTVTRHRILGSESGFQKGTWIGNSAPVISSRQPRHRGHEVIPFVDNSNNHPEISERTPRGSLS